MEPLFPESTVSEASCSTATRPSRMSVASSRSRELSSNSRSRVAASCRFTGRTRMASSVREAQRLVSSVVSWRVQEHGFELAVEFFLQGGLHGGEAVPDGFQRGVLVEQLFRRLRPHAADAGDVVAESPMIACTSGHCVGLRPVSSSKLLRVTIFRPCWQGPTS